MIHADLSRLNIPDELRQELDTKTRKLLSIEDPDERKAFISNHADLWGKVRPYLTEVTGNSKDDAKCWYCECKGPGFTHHVDHFRPKNRVKNKNQLAEPGYWWLAFDVTNYRLSCQRCNTGGGKRDQFPLAERCERAYGPDDCVEDEVILLLDPAHSGDRLLLAFSEDGRVYPRHLEGTFLAKKAKTSIEIYDLNHVSKVEARKQVWLDCKKLARRADRALDQAAMASPEALQSTTERLEEICQDIEMKMSSSAEFSAMARYCFRGTGKEWILELIS